jgi:group II intron reverse transcriptase/maturase
MFGESGTAIFEINLHLGSRMATERLVKRLNSLSNSKAESRVKDLHTLLYDESLWFQAYQNIYSNKGAFTKGSDDSDTLDNFDKERVNKIIASLKDESFKCKPARRINIPKANGSTRPLSIPCGTDKLVQEACRIILEAVYEPKFSDSSHGFRPGRSCHTALQKVSTWTSTKWWIEFDIKGCFDNIDHTILIRLLEKRIDDQKFLGLIRKFLNAGYLDNFQYHNTFSGTPQGGIISPLLANIYLHELDQYIDQLCEIKNNKEVKNNINNRYTELNNIFNNSKLKLRHYQEKYDVTKKYIEENLTNKNFSNEIEVIFKECFELNRDKEYSKLLKRCIKLEKLIGLNKSDLYQAFKVFEYKSKLEENKKITEEAYKERETIRYTENNPDFERLHYVRYADDFILGYIGTKKGSQEIYDLIVNFIKVNLKLETSKEKSRISFASDGLIFLGYNISMPKISDSKTKHVNTYGTEITRKRNIGKPVFKVPVERAIKFVNKKGYGSYVENTSTHRPYLQNFDEIEIIKQYNAELRGLIQYYKHAMNCKHIIGKVQWLWQYSLLKTLANKHKCSVAQVFKQNIIKVKLDQQSKSKIWYVEAEGKSFDIFNIKNVEYINMFYAKDTFVNDVEFTWQISKRSSALRKLIANECEICGTTNTDTKIILHHLNQIRTIPKTIPEWERVNRMRNRKTIALCHNCHMRIHHPK